MKGAEEVEPKLAKDDSGTGRVPRQAGRTGGSVSPVAAEGQGSTVSAPPLNHRFTFLGCT